MPHTKPIVVGFIYRPPSADANFMVTVEGHLSEVINLASNCDMVLTGDFNLDLLKPTSAKLSPNYVKNFSGTMSSIHLHV